MPSLPAEVPFTPVPWLTFEFQDLTMGVDLFLQGVLCAQFAHYTNVNQRDSVWMKLFVVGLALLTTLKTIQVLAMIGIQNVVLFENPATTHSAGGRAGSRKWLGQMNLILESGIAFYVQLFFCHRLWALSHNVYIMVVAISLFIFALVTASVAVYFSARPLIGTLMVSTHLGLAMGGDLLQTGTTFSSRPPAWANGIYAKLTTPANNTGKYLFISTRLSSALQSKHQSAAPGAFCALVNFVATISEIRGPAITPGPTPAFVISIIANIMLPKLYAMAAMWTLNYRDEIRSAATHLDFPSFGGMGVGDKTAPEIPRLRAGGIETSTTNSINAPENILPNLAERKA
ncbi:hypothetical protein B0H16DRAFT_1895042 [Mycena metata]|uniref:Uncharacterized protein n=1 Tax=Mycena metata TaxID=1033252 RepID=A0AAD7MNH6_9AGAR|nr:hypothetical protein B0H16DRAFT_1895042 [Mycena metata]